MSKSEFTTGGINGMMLGVGWEDGVEIHRMAAHLKEGLISVEQLCQFTRAIYERAFPNDVGTPLLTVSVANAIGTELRLIRECFEPAPPIPMQAEPSEQQEANDPLLSEEDQTTWDKICQRLLMDVDGEIGMGYATKPGEPPMVIITISTDSFIGRMKPGDRSASLGLIEGYLIQIAKMIPGTHDAVVVVLMAEPGEKPGQAWARHNRRLDPQPAAPLDLYRMASDLGQLKPALEREGDLSDARNALMKVLRRKQRREGDDAMKAGKGDKFWREMEQRHHREVAMVEGLWR